MIHCGFPCWTHEIMCASSPMRCQHSDAGDAANRPAVGAVVLAAFARARSRAAAVLLRPAPPPLAIGIAVAALLVATETVVVYPLELIAHKDALVAIYMLGVLAVSTVWGLRLGIAISLASALAFNLFHLPPLLRL